MKADGQTHLFAMGVGSRSTAALALAVFLLGMSVAGTGCASHAPSKQELATLSSIAAAHFADGPPRVITVVPYSGAAEDLSRALDPHGAPIKKQATSLATALAYGGDGSFQILVTGDSSRKTAETILAALLMQTRPLPYLHLLFVGDEKHREEVAHAVERAGARFTFVSQDDLAARPTPTP